ncbi:lipopolysaccharide biosynthesis protein [Ruoffia sp. FAM 20857]|uniref:lipopolysaccharide biosynthesis protein n=1 Tax=unclassified Ruoffia TaxID=2862149 RepID=UPI00388992AA
MNRKILNSFVWKLLERGGAQAVQVSMQLILARLLGPEILGRMAIILVFTNIFLVFIEGGFNTALIQKKKVDALDYSTVLVFSVLVSIFFYLLLYVLAPIIGNFYNDNELSTIIRILGVVLFPLGYNSIQIAYISRNQNFKPLFLSSSMSLFISGGVAVVLALNGFGIWVLVIQQIISSYLTPILLNRIIKFKVNLKFSLNRLRSMFKFGIGILAGNLIYSLYLDLRKLLIGKVYSTEDLGFYQRGELIPKSVVTNFDKVLQSIIFPTLSSLQDEHSKMKHIIKKTMEVSAFIIYPIGIGLFIVSEPLIIVILTDEWLEAVPYLRVFAITYALWPLLSLNLQSIKALGKSDLIVKMEFTKRVVGLLLIIITLPYGPYYIALGTLIERIIELFINAYPNRKLINFTLSEQFMVTLPSLTSAIVMLIIVYPINFLTISMYYKLILEISLGIIVYLLASTQINKNLLKYFIKVLKQK